MCILGVCMQVHVAMGGISSNTQAWQQVPFLRDIALAPWSVIAVGLKASPQPQTSMCPKSLKRLGPGFTLAPDIHSGMFG